MKLKTKIQVFSSLFMLILVLLVNCSVYILFHKLSTATELDELEVVTSDLLQALNDNPGIDPSGLMEAYLPTNGMIRIILKNDAPLIVQTRNKEYLTLSWKFSESDTQHVLQNDNSPGIAVIEKPIIWPTGVHKGEIVTIQISNHMVSLHETMRTLLYVLVILTLVILLPVIAAGSLLSKFLLRPIQNLMQTMKENIKLGKWQTIDVKSRSHDEIYEMEMTFNQMIEHLKESYEKQEIFVSDASHELKTPVQIIKSYAQLLERRENVDLDIFKESIEAIDSEADRMKKLIDQMLTLAKNKQRNHKEEVNLVEFVQPTATKLSDAYDRDILISLNEPEVLVHGDKEQLKQIIYILIDNAIKYSKDEIELFVYKHEGYGYIQVKDFGEGISSKDQQHIFDRFYRVDKARSRNTGGSGLGLSIAKAIAEANNAILSVESKVGTGSTFTLKLKLINGD